MSSCFACTFRASILLFRRLSNRATSFRHPRSLLASRSTSAVMVTRRLLGTNDSRSRSVPLSSRIRDSFSFSLF